MLEDIEYVAETSTAQKSARWYTRLWRACLCCGCLCNQKKKPQDHLIGYNPVGPLQRAASTGDLETLEQLLSARHFHVDECDRKNRTSLHYACAHNQMDAVTLLLDYSCSINIQDDEGCTPLIKAVQKDNLGCVCMLLWVGADPHVKDFNGHTALHHAVLRGNTTTIEALLEFNADIEAKTEYGLTPIQLAISENDHQMAEFLTSKGANAHSVADPNSKGTQAEDLEEKHVRFSKVVEIHYCTDARPSGRGIRPTRPLKSILKISSQISTAGGTDITSLRLDDKPIPDIPGSPIQGDASISVTKGLYCRIKKRAQAVVRKSQLNAHSSGEPIPDPWEEETPLRVAKKKRKKFPYALSAHGDTVPISSACAGDPGELNEEKDFAATHDTHMDVTPPTAAWTEDATCTPHVTFAHCNLVWWPTAQIWPIPSACDGDTGDIGEKNDFTATHDTNMDVTAPTTACPEDAILTKHADSQPTAGQCTDDDQDLALKAYRAEDKRDQLTADQQNVLDHDAKESLDPTQEDQFLLRAAHPSDHTGTTRDTKTKPVPHEEPQTSLFVTALLLLFLISLFGALWIIKQIQQVWNGESYHRLPSNKKDEQVSDAPDH